MHRGGELCHAGGKKNLIIALEVEWNADLFQCDTCSWGRHCDDANPAPIAKWAIGGVIESRTCLLPMITPASRFLVRLYRHYKERILPFAGGLLDQPHLYAEAMEILAAREATLRAEYAERQRRRGGAGLPHPGDV